MPYLILFFRRKKYCELLILQQVTDFSEKFLLCRWFRSRSRFSRLSLLFLLKRVDTLDHDEDTESDDNEINDILQELTILKFCIHNLDTESTEIYTASSKTYERHEHVIYET